jgi:hypothetical protein
MITPWIPTATNRWPAVVMPIKTVLAGDFTVIAGVVSARALVAESACADKVEPQHRMHASTSRHRRSTVRLNRD